MRVHVSHGFIFLLALEARRAGSVDLILHVTLELVVGVSEDFAVIGLLDSLRLGQAQIKHVLVVLHQGGVATELIIESVLRVR